MSNFFLHRNIYIFFTWAGFCTVFLSELDLVIRLHPEWNYDLTWFVGHEGNRYIKLENGATACHCLPFCLHTVCVCLPACSFRSDTHEAQCSISSPSDSYSTAENDIVSGLNTRYLNTLRWNMIQCFAVFFCITLRYLKTLVIKLCLVDEGRTLVQESLSIQTFSLPSRPPLISHQCAGAKAASVH